MSDQREKLFDSTKEGERRLDYFIAGLIGAVFAYSAQQYKPRRLDLDFSLAEPLGLLILVTGFWYALKRIESALAVSKLNFSLLSARDNVASLARALKENPQGGLDVHTGLPISVPEMQVRVTFYREEIVRLNDDLENQAWRSDRHYRVRTKLLVTGFLFLLAGKIAEPYFLMPNQSLEPMARSVTPSAGEEGAPSPAMAHH
jgi:hypothetical protein